MAFLKVGETTKDIYGNEIKVLKLISSSGGQGRVYLVEYCGKKKVLKWYKDDYLEELRNKSVRCNANGELLTQGAPREKDEKTISAEKAFYALLKHKSEIQRMRDNKEFVWPLAVTAWRENSKDAFGYIMDYIDTNKYKPLSKIIGNPKQNPWKTTNVKLAACLNLAKNFNFLHTVANFSYQDLSDGNIYIDTQTGEVRIADNDNVSRNGLFVSGIIGTSGYIAPEVMMGKATPSKITDRFSLAVLLFRILMNGPHPFEGKYSREVENEAVFFGSDPVFMFDPQDDRNRPEAGKDGEQTYARHSWVQHPKYIQILFARCFNKRYLGNPQNRPDEQEWLQALMRLRSECLICPYCNKQNKTVPIAVDEDNPSTATCRICGHKVPLPPYALKFIRGGSGATIRLIPSKKIYQCQYNDLCNDYTKEALATIKTGGELYLKNKSGGNFAILIRNKKDVLAPEQTIKVEEGLKIAFSRAFIAEVILLKK